MNRRISVVALAALALSIASQAALGGSIPSYYEHLNFNLTSPTAFTEASGGFINPSVYPMMPGGEAEFYWSNFDESGLDQWGLFTSAQNLGFGAVHTKRGLPSGEVSVTDYRIALAGGNRDITTGLAYGWSGGDTDQFDREGVLQLGLTWRLNHYVSLGGVEQWGMQAGDRREVFDVAVRPIGNDKLTLFGDLETHVVGGSYDSNVPWSAGAMVEVPAGLKLIGRVADSKDTESTFSIALAYSFGAGFHQGVLRGSAQQHYDQNNHGDVTTWGVRLGYPERSGLTLPWHRNSGYLQMHPMGPIAYARYRFFDDRPSLENILSAIDDARNDSRIAGIALNLSGSRFTRGQAWEIRQRLAEFRATGRKVVVFIDEASQSTYYLASVADYVMIDPEGMVVLPGYVMGRTYIANMLEKLGIGFEEFRFLKYKSAVESLARHNMSDADREQRQALVDQYYTTFRDDVSASRNVSAATVDHWINEQGIFTAQTALDNKLVDGTGRWDDMKERIGKLEGRRKAMVGVSALADRWYPPKQWGERDKIAVVYAIGACDMDTGINARRLERMLRDVKNRGDVKAVVLRVDSPGGSPMASDVVAGQLRAIMKTKPVVVSQGDVAASGGYWLSMCSNSIVSEPTTITGSIGVIAGWVWDNGLGKKTGMEGDFVKRGDHADVFFQLRPPYLPIPLAIPHRAVDDKEREVVLGTMKELYARFVDDVAANRRMEREKVESLAQGRVWTGMDAKKNGLVDRIGGLQDAIMMAREMAKIGPNDEAEVIEFAPRGLFKFDFPIPGMGASLSSLLWNRLFDGNATAAPEDNADEDYGITYIRHLVQYNGRAQCIVPPDMLPREGGE